MKAPWKCNYILPDTSMSINCSWVKVNAGERVVVHEIHSEKVFSALRLEISQSPCRHRSCVSLCFWCLGEVRNFERSFKVLANSITILFSPLAQFLTLLVDERSREIDEICSGVCISSVSSMESFDHRQGDKF